MGKIKEKRSYSKRKRKFCGNQWTKKDKLNVYERMDGEHEKYEAATTSSNQSSDKITPSEAKISHSTDNQPSSSENITGYRFVDMDNLLCFIQQFPCPACLHQEQSLFDVTEKNIGLSSKISFKCNKCGDLRTFTTSKKSFIGKFSEVNNRIVVATCAIGGHQKDCERFCANMNIPMKMSSKTWQSHVGRVHKATRKIANKSMLKAAHELHELYGSSSLVKDVTASCDGTWQRRGFQSKNGVGTLLSVAGNRSKVLDVEVLTNHCSQCLRQKKRLTSEEFERWFLKHKKVCPKNHEGSSGSMEPKAMETIFSRSQSKYNLRYTGYLGDGDSKSYHRVATMDPPIYDTPIKKLECCGHVQKRMGKRLTDRVKEMKNAEFTVDGKKVRGIGGSGKGRLTALKIKKLQGHYGAAIRNHPGDVSKMKKAIWATWHHRSGNHDDCGTWCPATKGNLEKADKNKFAPYVSSAIRPVYEALTKDSLLEACAHGGSQNSNESYHNMIWNRCPKQIFVGKRRLELAVLDAAIVYNEGETRRKAVFHHLGYESGVHCMKHFNQIDKMRISKAKRTSTDKAKIERQRKRYEESSKQEQHLLNEGETYVQGGF